MSAEPGYAARLEIDYPEKLDRLTTFLRIFWIIPIAIILGLVSGRARRHQTIVLNEAGEVVRTAQRRRLAGWWLVSLLPRP